MAAGWSSALLLSLLAATAVADYKTLLTRYSADPAPLVVGERLYIYATHDGDDHATSFSMVDYNVFSTADGVNWRDDGIAFSPVHNTSWAKNAWAQQTIWSEQLDRFLMYFPGGVPGSRDNVVGVASATDPRGPFVDYAGEAFAQGEDPTVCVEEDGRAVLCTSYGQPGGKVPWCAPLNPDMKSLARSQSRVVIEGLAPGQFFEAPWLFKRNGTYYLSFMTAHDCPCGGPFGYGIGYATNNSSDQLGSYTYQGPVMWPNPKNCAASSNASVNSERCSNSAQPSPGGNAHHGFALDFPTGSGQHWIAYHTRRLVVEKGEVSFSQRNVALDRMYFGEDGVILPVTSTPDWVKQQTFVNPFVAQPAAMLAASNDANGSSVFFSTEPGSADPVGGQWRVLSNITAGDKVRVKGVDLGIFESTAESWSALNFTARLSCSKPVLVEVAIAAGTGTANWPQIWPAPGQPALSEVLTDAPHARFNASAGVIRCTPHKEACPGDIPCPISGVCPSGFANITAPMVSGDKPWGVSHQVGTCGGPEGCPPSSLDLVITFRSATYTPPQPSKPVHYYTCFGLGIKDCTKPGESDCCSTANITGSMKLCFCMATFQHACDPRYPPVKPSAGGHGCYSTPTCAGVCDKTGTDMWSAAGQEPLRQQEEHAQAEAQAAAEAEAAADFTCSFSSWSFSSNVPAPPVPVMKQPDPVATAVALRSRATGKYVAAMTANKQGEGEVTAGWCHISIEAVWNLYDNGDGSHALIGSGNSAALARCGKGESGSCGGTAGGVGTGSHSSPSSAWRIIGTPDGGYVFQAADSPTWPATGLMLAPTGREPTTYDGQLLMSGGMDDLAASNASVSAGCAVMLEDTCLPWLGQPTHTCIKHCSTHPGGHEADEEAHTAVKYGCKVKPGLPKDYKELCASKLSPKQCDVVNATCVWKAQPPMPPPAGCTAAEVGGWCDGGQAAVFDVCKITVVGQTLIDCGGCHPCCGTGGRPGDCSRDPNCEIGP